MKIAICSDQPDLSGRVPELFLNSPWLLIVEDENSRVLETLSRTDFREDKILAKAILKNGCEGLLCGPIEREPFLIIADEGQVTRYNAAGLGAAQALDLFRQRNLELIRDHIGADGHHRPNPGICSERQESVNSEGTNGG